METITIENELLKLTCISRGATIVSLEYKPLQRNLITSFETLEQFEDNTKYYLGTTVAPSAGRIAQGQFVMNNKIHKLERNSGAHHLHGGSHGLSTQLLDWKKTDNTIEFFGTFDHRIDNYPGEITYKIIYELKGQQLLISLEGTPDVKMPLNMANHMYFNLDGSDSVLDHKLQVSADSIVQLADNGAPSNKLLRVKDTVFDFRSKKPLRQLLQGHPQFEISRLLDHAFVLKTPKTLILEGKDLSMTVETTSESIVLYTANHFDEQFVRDNHELAKNQQSVAIEAQKIPNGVNTSLDKNPFHNLENPFNSQTIYTFDRIS